MYKLFVSNIISLVLAPKQKIKKCAGKPLEDRLYMKWSLISYQSVGVRTMLIFIDTQKTPSFHVNEAKTKVLANTVALAHGLVSFGRYFEMEIY